MFVFDLFVIICLVYHYYYQCIYSNIEDFFSDIKVVKESRAHFEKVSNEHDGALQRNSQASRLRPSESEDTTNLLVATRKLFGHIALTHLNQLTMMNVRKPYEIISTVSLIRYLCILLLAIYFK